MCLIEHQKRIETLFQFNKFPQPCAIAIHRKNRFSDHDDAFVRILAPSPSKMAFQFGQMIVRKHAPDRVTEFRTIDKGCMAELVENNNVIFTDQGRDRAERCSISATETKRG